MKYKPQLAFIVGALALGTIVASTVAATANDEGPGGTANGSEIGQAATSATTARVASAEEMLAADGGWYAEAFGVSQEEAERRMALQDDAGTVIGRLTAIAPDRFAGAWVDNEAATFAVTVRYTGPAGGIDGLERILGDAAVPVVVQYDAPHSQAELLEALKVLGGQLESVLERDDLGGMGADVQQGQLYIHLQLDSAWVGSEAVLAEALTQLATIPVDVRVLPERMELQGRSGAVTHTPAGW